MKKLEQLKLNSSWILENHKIILLDRWENYGFIKVELEYPTVLDRPYYEITPIKIDSYNNEYVRLSQNIDSQKQRNYDYMLSEFNRIVEETKERKLRLEEKKQAEQQREERIVQFKTYLNEVRKTKQALQNEFNELIKDIKLTDINTAHKNKKLAELANAISFYNVILNDKWRK